MKAGDSTRSNPFPGLRPFRSDEHHLFFGREEQTAALLQLLRTSRFLAVVGTSGSGKSSLVRAGMIAELHGGTMTKAGSTWEVMILRPGGSPIENLARAMVEADLYDAADASTLPRLLATLNRSRFGLVEAMKQSDVFETGANLLVVVDQFEELFRFRQQGVDSEERAAAFVNLLLTATQQTECSIYVAITMRSDYLGDCSEIPGLAEAVNDGEYLIPRLQRDQKRDAIEKPIGVGGATISALLVQRLLNEVGDDPDQLPVLQHALMRMWNSWSAGSDHHRPIDFGDFEATGGLGAALSNHADEIYDSLPDDRHRSVCAKIFKTLTEKGTDNRGIRRPTRLAQLQAITASDRDTVTRVLDAFRESGVTFVMPGTEVELTDRTVLDLSHESLMRGWQRLRGWVEDEAQSARIFRRLLDTARLWSDGKAGLFRDPDLQIAISSRAQEAPTSEWAEQYGGHFETAIGFLEASNAEAQAERHAKEAARQRELEQARQLAEAQQLRLDQQQRSASRLRKLIAGLAAVAVIAGLACAAALVARNETGRLKIVAEQEADKARLNEEEAKKNALRAEQSEHQTANALATVKAQKDDVEANLSNSLEYFRDALQKADGYEARKSIFSLLARFDMVLNAYVEQQPLDQQLQLTLARRLAERGQQRLAQKQPAKAQAELEKSRAIFTRLLSAGKNWQVVTPIEMRSETGAKMTPQPDGSVFVDQNQFAKSDNYTLVFQTEMKGITGLRLEVLADSRLTGGGPGWGFNGQFQLRELTLYAPATSDRVTLAANTVSLAAQAQLVGGGPAPYLPGLAALVIPSRSIALTAAADFSQVNGDVRGAVDGNLLSGWAVWPEVNKDHTAVFELAEPVGNGHGILVTVRLKQTNNLLLGRFRLSFTTDATAAQAARIRWNDLLDSELADMHAALGKAYGQQDRTKEAVASFAQALPLAVDRAGKAKIIAEAAPLKGVLAKLTELAAGDGRFQAELALHYAHRDNAPMAEAARKKARALFEKKLAKDPENFVSAAELAQLLLDNQKQEDAGWTLLKPLEAKSLFGATLSILPDGSILASGANPVNDRYRVVATVGADISLSAIRLEALTHAALPGNGPGRNRSGSFVQNSLMVIAMPPDRKKPVMIQFDNGWTDHDYGKLPTYSNGYWNIGALGGQNCTAIWSMPTPVTLAAGTTLTFDFRTGGGMLANLGRFRLATSAAFGPDDKRFSAQKLTDPWLRLATAYALNGLNDEALPYFSRKLKRAVSYETRKPIIEIAARFDEVLFALSKQQPDDPQLQLAEARARAKRGNHRLARKQPALAQTDLEKSREIFTRLHSSTKNWTVLTPLEMKTVIGAAMRLQDDDSIFVLPSQPDKNDTYTLVCQSELKGITGLRLEVLADRRLPSGGPGWGFNGNFQLNELTLQVAPADKPGKTRAIFFRNAWADFSEVTVLTGGTDVRGAIDGNPYTGWAVWPEVNKNHTAVFELAEKVGDGQASRLTVRLLHQFAGHQDHNLGRFRLSVTNDGATLQSTRAMLSLKDSELAEMYAALGKAYGQQDRTKEAVASFTEALQLAADRAGKAKVIAEAAPLKGMLEKLAERAANDGQFLAELARYHAERGNAPLADTAHKKARAWFEEKLAKEPESLALAAELAELLLDKQEKDNAARWTVLMPTEIKSEGGAKLTLQPDGSILASGTNPDKDVYVLVAKTDLKKITAIRLEALLDPSLPSNGPGRSPEIGNFHLNKLRVFASGAPVPLTKAVLAYHETGHLQNVIDGPIDTSVGWSNSPRAGKSNTAIVASLFQRAPDDDLKIELYFSRSNYTRHNLGRFRLSVSGDADIFAREAIRLAAMKTADPLTKLAAAYDGIGDQPALEKLLKQHPAVVVGVGDVYAAAQDWERAIATYSSLITEKSADAKVLVKRAAAYEATKQLKLAAADWVRAERQQPGTVFEPARQLALSGVSAFESGRTAEAIRILQQARDRLRILFEANPKDGSVASQLSTTLGFLGSAFRDEARPAESQASLKEQVKVMAAMRQPSSMDLYNLACAYASLSGLVVPGSASAPAEREALAEQAMDTLRRSIAAGMKDFAQINRDHDLDPIRERPDFQVLILEGAGRTREALPILAKVSAANPKDTILSLKVAALQAWFGQDKELAVTRQRILAFAKGTDDAVTAERAARACSILPSTDKEELATILALSRTAAKNGKREWTLLAHGMAEFRSGNYAAADEALLAAAQADPKNAVLTGISRFYRVMSLLRQDKKEEARKLALKAAKMKPLPRDENNPLIGDANSDDLILWLAYKETGITIPPDHAVGLVYHYPGTANLYWSRFTPDGTAFIAGGDAGPSGYIRLWDVATGKQLQVFAPGGNPWFSGGLFLPDGKQLLTWYSHDSNLLLWDVATGRLVRKIRGPAINPLSVAVAPDGKRFLAGGNNNVLFIYDIVTGKELARLDGHTDKCSGIFSPDGKQVLSFGPDRTLRLWDAENGKLLRTLEGHTAGCTGVFSSDGKQVLSYGKDKTVRLWDAATGKAVRSFAGPTDEVTSASFLPGGDKVVAWGKDWNVRVWDARNGKQLHQFVLNDKTSEAPHQIAMTPDGRRLLVAGAGNTLLILDLATGNEIQRFNNAFGRHGFSISPDGRYAAAGSFRAGVYLWRLPD